jgi:hypothetical protein
MRRGPTVPTTLDYPIIVITDLHGQLAELKLLVEKLERVPDCDECVLVFLGDLEHRTELGWTISAA